MDKRAATGGRPYTLFETLIVLGRINCLEELFLRSSFLFFPAVIPVFPGK